MGVKNRTWDEYKDSLVELCSSEGDIDLFPRVLRRFGEEENCKLSNHMFISCGAYERKVMKFIVASATRLRFKQNYNLIVIGDDWTCGSYLPLAEKACSLQCKRSSTDDVCLFRYKRVSTDDDLVEVAKETVDSILRCNESVSTVGVDKRRHVIIVYYASQFIKYVGLNMKITFDELLSIAKQNGIYFVFVDADMSSAAKLYGCIDVVTEECGEVIYLAFQSITKNRGCGVIKLEVPEVCLSDLISEVYGVGECSGGSSIDKEDD